MVMPKTSIEERPLSLQQDNATTEDVNSGLRTIHQQIYGYRASAYLVPNSNDVTLHRQEIEERRRKRQAEETSLVTNIVFFLLCLLILVIILAIVWFRFLKPRIEK